MRAAAEAVAKGTKIGGEPMTRRTAAVAATLLAAAWMFYTDGARASEYCSGLPECGHDKVAVIRCETDSDGGIKVRNSSVTSATGVTVRRGDKCAATVSALLQAGLRMAYGPRVTPSPTSTEVSFSFVFRANYSDDSSDDDDDRDDDDDD